MKNLFNKGLTELTYTALINLTTKRRFIVHFRCFRVSYFVPILIVDTSGLDNVVPKTKGDNFIAFYFTECSKPKHEKSSSSHKIIVTLTDLLVKTFSAPSNWN